MQFLSNFPLFSIIICFVGVVLCSLLPAKKARNVAFSVEGLCFLLGIGTLIFTLKYGDTVYQMGHLSEVEGDPTKYYWYNNVIRFGVLEAMLATFFPLVLFLAILGGLRKLEHDVALEKERFYYVLSNLVLVALLALVYTDDIFTGYVFLEISTLSSIGLIAIKNKGRTTVAAVRYMIFNLVGSGLFLIGIVLLYNLTGYFMLEKIMVELTNIVNTTNGLPAVTISLALISIGLGIKSGLFPFYFWMPDTYGESTTSSASIISGFISKGYIILLIKFIVRAYGFKHQFEIDGTRVTFGVVEQTGFLNVLFVLGVCGMIFGSISAIKQKRINKMIAFSSAAQIGYIYLAIGLGEVGVAPAIFQILCHAITKPLLFTSARGLIDVSEDHPQFKYLRNSGRRNILAGIGYSIGALSMIGFPLFAGFALKVVYVESALESASMIKIVVTIAALVISTLLNTIYFIRTMIIIYTPVGEGEEEVKKPENYKLRIGFIISIIGFALLNIALGVLPQVITTINQAIETIGYIIF